MKFYPAIDLVNGCPVRLSQGDFDRETRYDATPEVAARTFAEAGADLVHVVDLDGAREGKPQQYELIARMAEAAPIQAAGGVRNAANVATLLDAGIQRVVIGSLALTKPDAFADLLDHYGRERITLALDVNMKDGVPEVATHGWKQSSGLALGDVLSRFPSVKHLLVTDIGRDGMMTGPNVPLIESIVADYPTIALQASGGVGTLDDLDTLRDAGAHGVIVGKAIWEGVFTAAEGASRARG